MTVLDLTHTISPGMPTYPGDPVPILAPAATLERDGFRASRITLGSHTGTHMDAPAHLLAEAGLMGVGVDAPSVDKAGHAGLPNHRTLFNRGVCIVENLVEIGETLERAFIFCALPLRCQRTDGAPVRAVALL